MWKAYMQGAGLFLGYSENTSPLVQSEDSLVAGASKWIVTWATRMLSSVAVFNNYFIFYSTQFYIFQFGFASLC
jgi:hypothetical protein